MQHNIQYTGTCIKLGLSMAPTTQSTPRLISSKLHEIFISINSLVAVCALLQLYMVPLMGVIYFILLYLISDIIHHNDAMGSSVVTGSDGAKPFLSSSIPL